MAVAYCEPAHAQDSSYRVLEGGSSSRGNNGNNSQQEQQTSSSLSPPSSQHQQLLARRNSGEGRHLSLNDQVTSPVVMVPPLPHRSSSSSSLQLNPPFFSPIPARYIRGCAGDLDEAGRRWRETLIWRSENDIDNILYEPQPNFRIIKECYPHFVHRRDKFGHPIYYELLGRIDLKRLKANGVSVQETVRYYIFLTEYIWNRIEPDQDHG